MPAKKWLLIDKNKGERRRLAYVDQYVLFYSKYDAEKEAVSRGYGENSPFPPASMPDEEGRLANWSSGDIDISVLCVVER